MKHLYCANWSLAQYLHNTCTVLSQSQTCSEVKTLLISVGENFGTN